MMRSLRLLMLPALICLTASCSSVSTPDAHPCDGVTCSGKGSCAVLNEQPTCSCELGYQADSVNGLSCVLVGAQPADAGNASPDANTPETDAGVAPNDAGTSHPDSSAAPNDAGPQPGDAGAADDGGVTPADDAGTPPDAGGVPAQACQEAHCRGDNETQPGEGVFCSEHHFAYFPSQSATPELEGRLTRSQPIPGEPVVADGLSQLMWTGCALGLSGSECQNGTMNTMDSTAYEQACERLSWAGFDDWVRPQGILLASLIDRRYERPVLDTSIFPNLGSFDGEGRLALRRSSETNNQTISLELEDSRTLLNNSESTHLLCVRSSTQSPVQPLVRRCFETTFGAQAAPTTTDPSTGLVWQSCAAGLAGADCSSGTVQRMGWQEAYDYCDNLDWAGETDWRLPSLDQMHSIIGQSPNLRDELPAGGFGAANRLTSHWTRTQRPLFGNRMFMTHEGANANTNFSAVTAVRTVRCVRGTRWSQEITYPERVCRTVRPVRHAELRTGEDLQLTRTESPSAGEYIVTDSYNGVQWTGCLLGTSGANCDQGSATNFGSLNTLRACANLTWGGHDDWRLATLNELRSLIDYDSGSVPPLPARVLEAFPNLDHYTRLSADNRFSRFRPGITQGFQNYGGAIMIQNERQLLCVRDHGERPPRTLQHCLETTAWSRTEGTVIDRHHGVEWMACMHGLNGPGCGNGSQLSVDPGTATDTCNNLNWAGHNDWRVPTYAETLTVMDSSRYYGVKKDHRAFPWHTNAAGAFAGWTSSLAREGRRRIGSYTYQERSVTSTEKLRCVRSLD